MIKDKKKPGPHPIKIDWEIVTKYLQAGCSGVEIAAAIGVHENTLYSHCKVDNGIDFMAYSGQKKAHGNTMLKAKQFQIALAGDKTMLIWLGKQRLDQTDKQAIDHTLNLAELFQKDE